MADSVYDSSEQLVGSLTIGVKQLAEDLRSISSRWEDFGSHLAALTPNQLDDISGKYGLVSYCYKRVIKAWMDGPTENFTKATLVNALAVINHGRLARQVQEDSVILDYKMLLGVLDNCRLKYFELGVQLGIKPNDIKAWEKNTDGHDSQRCLIEVLNEWLKSQYAREDCWLDNLVNALKYIRHTRLAEELKKKYKGKTLEKI